MTVLRFDDGELLFVDVVGLRVGLPEDDECGFEEAEAVALAAAAALRLLYCDAFVMIEVAINVIVERTPLNFDTMLCRVEYRVLNAVGVAADMIVRTVFGAVTEVEIIDGRVETVETNVGMLFEYG